MTIGIDDETGMLAVAVDQKAASSEDVERTPLRMHHSAVRPLPGRSSRFRETEFPRAEKTEHLGRERLRTYTPRIVEEQETVLCLLTIKSVNKSRTAWRVSNVEFTEQITADPYPLFLKGIERLVKGYKRDGLTFRSFESRIEKRINDLLCVVKRNLMNAVLRVSYERSSIDVEELLVALPYKQIFVECVGLRDRVRAFKRCHEIADILEKRNITKFNPIIVSVANAPEDEQRELLQYFGDRGIAATLKSYDDYVAAR
jgi:hypothetical protein